VKDGLAPRLIITELPPPYASQRPFAEALLSKFKPEVELVDLGPTFNTRDEAVMAAEYLKKRGLSRIIVTSSPTHTFRARRSWKLGLKSWPPARRRFDLETLDRPRSDWTRSGRSSTSARISFTPARLDPIAGQGRGSLSRGSRSRAVSRTPVRDARSRHSSEAPRGAARGRMEEDRVVAEAVQAARSGGEAMHAAGLEEDVPGDQHDRAREGAVRLSSGIAQRLESPRALG
jgi:hypothetical protein